MANEFKIKHGFVSTGNGTIDGELAISGALYADSNARVATRDWVSNTALSGYATETYVTTAISNLADSAPDLLNTLDELAAALGDDPNFATTITNSIATKLSLSGGTMTGNITFTDDAEGIVWSRNTDGAFIKFYNTSDGDTDSRLEFHTNDNNNEYFRWTHGPSGANLYEAMKLAPIGAGSSVLTVQGEIFEGSERVATQTHVSSNYLSKFHDIDLTLSGDVTGSGTFNNMGDLTITTVVANDSHTHDGRYYTETESDARFVNTGGDTMTGTLAVPRLRSSGYVSANSNKLSLGILDLNSSGTPTQFRINTQIPWPSGSADFTVNIKGFAYGDSDMVSLSIGWHHYNNTFYNENAISNGSWSPEITLARDPNDLVVIHLSGGVYWPKLYVESLYSSSYQDQFSDGWNWVDQDLADCTDVSVVPYRALQTNITGSANTLDGLDSSQFLRSDATDSASGKITFAGGLTASGGIDGLTLSNGISGTNFNITGVNELSIADPGEGIVFTSGSSGNISLAIVDDSSDNRLNLSGTGASFSINNALVATQSWVSSQGYLTSITSHTHAAEDVTGGILGQSGKIALANHPEGGALLTPSFDNDLAFVVERGGAVNVYITDSPDYTEPVLNDIGSPGFSASTPFNGTTNYSYGTLPGTDSVVVWDVEMPFSLSYGNTWYVDFGAGAWRAKNVTFLAYQTSDNAETNYKVVGGTFTNNSSPLMFTSGGYTNVRASNGTTNYSYNRLRVVMTNWNTANPRVAAIGAKYYNSQSLAATLMSKGGGTMYGNLTIDSTSAWNASTPMLNIGGNGDGRIQVRHIWGKESNTANPDHLWLQHTNTGHHVQIGNSGGGNDLYVSGDIYANGYFTGNKVATESWVTSQNYLTALPSHNHDDRYYTETEVNTLLGGKLSTGGGTLSGSLNINDGLPAGGSESYLEYSKVVFENSHNDIARGPNKIVMHDNGSGWAGGFGIHSSTVAYYSGDKHSWYKTNSNGTFTERMTLDASGNLSIDGTLSASGYNKSNWDTAYNWGDHASAGYLTGITSSQVTTALGYTPLSTTGKAADSNLFDGIDSVNFVYGNAKGTNDSVITDNDALDKTGYYTSAGFAVRPADVPNWMYIEHIKLYNNNTGYQKQLGYDTYDNRMWVRTKEGGGWLEWAQVWTSDVFANNSSNWDTAYSWGDHASAGYLTSGSISGYATESYVTTQINNLIDSAPGALNTLNELAAAIGDDANFATTVTNSIATKVPLSGDANISGMKTFETALTNNEDWESSPISILERDAIGTGGNGSDVYAPNINFHWRNRVSRSIWMDATGDFHFGEYTAEGVPGNTGAIYVGGGNSDQWNTAYSWGNHAGLYLGATAKAADSNLLDGLDLHTGRNNQANKVVRTDANGYIQAGWINTPSGAAGTINKIYCSQDDYVRYLTPANFRTQVTDGSYDALGAADAVNDRIDSEVLPAIPTNNNQLTNGAGYITDGNTNWNNTYGFITASSTDTLTNKSGNISQWTNDSGYLTSVPRDVANGTTVLDRGVEFHDGGGDLSWAIGANDRGGVGQVGQNALVFRTRLGTRFQVGTAWADEGTEVMTLDDSGNVGIGVPQAEITERLNVQGNIRGTGNLSVDGSISASGYNSVNWDTAYGWGNHASAGYLTTIPTNTSGSWWGNGFVKVLTDGVMEVGKYIDFHDTNAGTSDFSYRITNTGDRLYFGGDIEIDGGDIFIADGNTRLHEGGGNALRVTTNSGYVEMGPMNTSHCHIQTDRSNFYFNTEIRVNGGIIGSYDEDLSIRRAGTTKIYVGSADTTLYNNVLPGADRVQILGRDDLRWQIVFCEILDSAGQHEKNLQNPEGEKSVAEYATGTVLVWKDGKNVPCTEYADHMRMGVAVEGIDSPLIQGAEPVLVTGLINEGDYLITSRKEGHAEAISPEAMRQQGLYDCVFGKALESGDGESHLVKVWINI